MMSSNEISVYSQRLAKLVKKIDEVGSSVTYKVKRNLKDIEEKLVLAHQPRALEYFQVEYEGFDRYKTIKFYEVGGKEYSCDCNTLKSDEYTNQIHIAKNVINYI